MRRNNDMWAQLIWLALAHLGIGYAVWWTMQRFEPAHPEAIWILAIVPVIAIWVVLRRNERHATVRLSTLSGLRHAPTGLRVRLRHLPFAATLTGLALLLTSMIQPQSKDSWQDVTREGIDIMIALDISASMLAKDLEPNRLDASKAVAMQFIDERPNDRIGLVVYEGEAFTQCPLTTDHNVLKDLFQQVRSGAVQGGTAVGMGLATAVNRLRESDSKSRVIILLTDGVNNAGTVQPLDAAQLAQQYGQRVYTIGVGTRGQALSPVARYPNGQYKYDHVPVEIDEEMLQQVADITGGQYFRATDERKLRDIYAEIDQMERTRIKVTEHSRRNEEYFPLLAAGLGLLALGFVMDKSLIRTTP